MKVLLARPHDFLVADMQAWLRSLGLEPVRLAQLAELGSHDAASVKGVVVSAAVTSAISESPGAVYLAVRRFLRTTPVIVAGLASLESARAGLAPEFKGAALFGPEEAASWGTPGALLYVSGDALRVQSAVLAAAAKRHLGLSV